MMKLKFWRFGEVWGYPFIVITPSSSVTQSGGICKDEDDLQA